MQSESEAVSVNILAEIGKVTTVALKLPLSVWIFPPELAPTVGATDGFGATDGLGVTEGLGVGFATHRWGQGAFAHITSSQILFTGQSESILQAPGSSVGEGEGEGDGDGVKTGDGEGEADAPSGDI